MPMSGRHYLQYFRHDRLYVTVIPDIRKRHTLRYIEQTVTLKSKGEGLLVSMILDKAAKESPVILLKCPKSPQTDIVPDVIITGIGLLQMSRNKTCSSSIGTAHRASLPFSLFSIQQIEFPLFRNTVSLSVSS